MQNSPSTSEPEIPGLASDAISDMNRQQRLYTVVIFGDEAERMSALTTLMQTPFVTAVINCGVTETADKTTSISKNDSLAKKVIRLSRYAPTPSGEKTTNLPSSPLSK